MNENMEVDDHLLGKAIARIRTMRGLTQVQLNEILDMRTIQFIEQGRNKISLTSLNKIASALNIPAACLVLLGTKIKANDKVLTNLRALLEQSLELGKEKNRTKDERKAKPNVRNSNGRQKQKVRNTKGKSRSKVAAT